MVKLTNVDRSAAIKRLGITALKKHLGVQNFRIDAEVQQAVLKCLHNLDTNFYNAGFDVPYWKNGIDANKNITESLAHQKSFVLWHMKKA
ncbi:hypothetical protein TNCV_4434731 [Trichonephila clavipes]|nr:hypothetical protein TNCV_4434731 [Trichonephila clavipes]